MGEWRRSTWGNEITLEYGKAIRGYQNAVGPYRVYGTNGPVGWVDKPLAPGPGIILGRKGAYRGVHFSPNPFFVIDTAYYVRPKSKDLDMRWLYYAMVNDKLGEIDDGSPVPSTPRAAVYPRALTVPPLPEQRAIAAVLSALDDKIELNRRMNATLEAMARALFKDWFVDFGPTRAKMQEAGSGSAATGNAGIEGREPYLAPDLWPLFPARLDDQGIPEGWEEKCLRDILELAYGKSLPAKKRLPGDVPVYGSGGITGFHNEALVEHPTIIVGRKGTVGSLYWQPAPCFPIDTVFFVKPKVALVYCYYLLQTLGLDQMNTDAAVPGLNRENAYRLPIVWPGSAVLDAFETLVGPLRNRMDANERESRTLAQTRDLLLPRLMCGELRVAEAEKIVEGMV
ncbi:type I restriction enzyme S subunit [Albidovulum inexpectatum]|uniref:Type I restriction enzyme S subunit n=1 Tax=Albidovulum inexpectatum TaxID=196587 RepID=A0A2S5JD95_9RHOB|nr:restriction endonuclease subunit S [Albidovulum inexpectatum]PPB79441.1 type I restriction enzyme S subunit [Albidovulum inexpectatum]